ACDGSDSCWPAQFTLGLPSPAASHMSSAGPEVSQAINSCAAAGCGAPATTNCVVEVDDCGDTDAISIGAPFFWAARALARMSPLTCVWPETTNCSMVVLLG